MPENTHELPDFVWKFVSFDSQAKQKRLPHCDGSRIKATLADKVNYLNLAVITVSYAANLKIVKSDNIQTYSQGRSFGSIGNVELL